jgi:hypothetical protein
LGCLAGDRAALTDRVLITEAFLSGRGDFASVLAQWLKQGKLAPFGARTIAFKLSVESGMDPRSAVDQVIRPG